MTPSYEQPKARRALAEPWASPWQRRSSAVCCPAAGLSGSQAESTRSWSAAPESFMSAFDYTVHIVNGFGPPALLLSAPRSQGWG